MTRLALLAPALVVFGAFILGTALALQLYAFIYRGARQGATELGHWQSDLPFRQCDR
jgi:hypothetical protein